jgi:hypothetical protein
MLSHTITLRGSVGDPGPLDSVSALVDWGDGTSDTFPYAVGTTALLAEHHYAREGQFSIRVTTTDDNGGSASNSVSATILVSSPETRFVAQAYRDLLQRDVDDLGLASWVAAMAQGASGAQVIAGIETSLEYRTDQIQEMYQTLLGRPAEAQGLDGWLGFLETGHSLTDVEEGILSSAEYFQARGGESTASYLEALYQDVFHRPIDPIGGTMLGQALDQDMPRSQAVAALFASVEFRSRLTQDYYQRFLGREAEDAAEENWVNAQAQGLTAEQVLAGIAGSAEYFERL